MIERPHDFVIRQQWESLQLCNDIQNVASSANPHANMYNVGHQMTCITENNENLLTRHENAPLEHSNNSTTISYNLFQHLSSVARACADAQQSLLKITLEFSRLMETMVNSNLLGNFQTSIFGC